MITRAPNWTFDEILLVATFAASRDWKYPAKDDPEVMKLSQTLRSLPIHHNAALDPRFRNTNGVLRKFSDINTIRPQYEGKPTHGSKVDQTVLDYVLNSFDDAEQESLRITHLAKNGTYEYQSLPEQEAHKLYSGRQMFRQYLKSELDPSLRKRKIQSTIRAHGEIRCEACNFSFEDAYGSIGSGLIELHLDVQLSRLAVDKPLRTRDTSLLCANCHRVAHQRGVLTTQEIKELL